MKGRNSREGWDGSIWKLFAIWIRSQAAHRHRLQPHRLALRRGKYAACLQCYFPPRLLSILFLPWFLLPRHSCAITSAQICQPGLVNHAHLASCRPSCRKEAGPAHVFTFSSYLACLVKKKKKGKGKKMFALCAVASPKTAEEKGGHDAAVCPHTHGTHTLTAGTYM